MGALVTRALRPIRSYNIENRAHRVISKEKPTPAPTYPQNIEDLKRTLEADPNLDELLDKKDPELDLRLRDVYVTSHGRPEDDITRETQQKNPDRPLPENRKQVEDFEYGFKEPERIAYGRTTIRQAMDFLTAHQSNPTEVTASKIAEEYKLKLEHVEDVLKYYKTYEVYIPKTKHAPATFAGPATARRQLEMMKTKQLESNTDKKYEIKPLETDTKDSQDTQKVEIQNK